MKKDLPVLELKMVKKGLLKNQPNFSSPREVIPYLLPHFKDLDREVFKVVLLTGKNSLIGIYTASVGTLDQASVHPREIIKPALLYNATAIILVHNHPSGSCHPSDQDQRITDKIKKLASEFGITVHDHIVLGEDKAYCISSLQSYNYDSFPSLAVNDSKGISFSHLAGIHTINLSNGSPDGFVFGIPETEAILNHLGEIKLFYEKFKHSC